MDELGKYYWKNCQFIGVVDKDLKISSR
ncbi:hypothetical protein M8J75_015342 [Diaphorina citri]|nr:hypothetical protein M8J75_015342 [Diaphorina citri]